MGEQGVHSVWWLERMEGAGEGKSNGGHGLRFCLQFDPGKLGLDRGMLGFPVSALLGHLLGWSKSSRGGEAAAAAVAVVASAFAVYIVAIYASDHQRSRRSRRRRLAGMMNSAARPRALPTPDDGLRILSSNEESLENVIHGASVGAWDDEPVIVARVLMNPTDTAVANAGDETEEQDQSEKEREEEIERLKELWLSLLEREQRLQLRLAELDELREQEATVRELERRVRVAAVEARLLELKASSLQEENQRLEAQVSELDAVRAKLARAKEKLRELKARVQREQEEAQRVAAALRDRVTELEKNGEERERALAAEAAAIRQRMTELEKNGQERERALAAEADAARQRMTELEKNGQERERALAAAADEARQRMTELEKNGQERERALAAAADEARQRMTELEKNGQERERALAAEADAARQRMTELEKNGQERERALAAEANATRQRMTGLEKNSQERERALAAEANAARQRMTELEKNIEERERDLAAEAAVVWQRMAELEKNVEERERSLAEEAAALRQANAGLEEENLELALRLQDAEQVASTVNLVLEEDVVKEANYMRETNERLTRQIEQLHSDHCAHVEELVYLKWVNACLRYELHGQDGDGENPSSGKPEHDGSGSLSARDLSKSMSFRSSEKAKELMLRYGYPGLDGFDPALFSPMHESVYGDGNEYQHHHPRGENVDGPPRSPDPSASPSKRAGSGNKLKFLGNIKKLLVTGKRGHGHGHGDRRGSSKIQAAAPVRDEHLEKALQWLSSHDVLYDDDSYESTPLSSSCERTPLSSVTTAGSSHAREMTSSAAGAAASRLLEAETARSRSDLGASSYGREASQYHALRPDHPALTTGQTDDDGGPRASPEKRELRRRSEELRSPAAVYASARDHMHELQSNA
ncbi:hypothetical protein ABZP36_014542 [Zizania latifolia]